MYCLNLMVSVVDLKKLGLLSDHCLDVSKSRNLLELRGKLQDTTLSPEPEAGI